MSDFEWDPETYLALMAEEIPDYPRLQTEVAAAAATGAAVHSTRAAASSSTHRRDRRPGFVSSPKVISAR